jgi:CO/xanthine dehydrogenase FAD-binding subunit
VNIKNISGLDSLSKDAKGLKIGATVKISDIASSEELRSEYPALARAARSVASPPIREMSTIDFAIVSIAAAITVERGKVSDARIVLGAVAPMPYRAVSAENALKGKVIDDAIAETAAAAAVKDAVPLSCNKYKIEIARALVKRAILD